MCRVRQQVQQQRTRHRVTRQHGVEQRLMALLTAHVAARSHPHRDARPAAEGRNRVAIVAHALELLEHPGIGNVSAAGQHDAAAKMSFGTHVAAARNDARDRAAGARLHQRCDLRAEQQRHAAAVDLGLQFPLEHFQHREATAFAPEISSLGIRVVAPAQHRMAGSDLESAIHQPIGGGGGVIHREPEYFRIRGVAADPHHVVVMLLGRVVYPQGPLQLGARRAHLARRQQECAARARRRFDEQDTAAAPRCENRQGHSGGARADHDDVPGPVRRRGARGRMRPRDHRGRGESSDVAQETPPASCAAHSFTASPVRYQLRFDAK